MPACSITGRANGGVFDGALQAGDYYATCAEFILPNVLTMYNSADENTWTPIPVNYTPAYSNGSDTSGVRDVDLWKAKSGGGYYIAHTIDPTGQDLFTGAAGTWVPQFAIASSTDLLNWTSVALPDMSEGGSGIVTVWAPRYFLDSDGSEHIFFTASQNAMPGLGNFQLYETHPTTPGVYTAWSTPVLITGTSIPSIVIDPFMVKIGSTYYLWYTNGVGGGGTGYSGLMSSTSLTSGYTIIHDGSTDWMGTGLKATEGTFLVYIGGSSWRYWCDGFDGSNWVARHMDSADNWTTWSDLVTTAAQGVKMDHGTFFTYP